MTANSHNRAALQVLIYGAQLLVTSLEAHQQTTQGPKTLNRYAYTIGDPINFVDHSGHRPDVTGGPEGLDVYNSVSETP